MVDLMNEAVVKAMFETLPVEITVIDANDKVIGWNKHHNRLFYRPMAAMEMDFRECHPKKSLDLVEKIVTEMKQGKRDKARFWIDMTVNKETGERHKILIEFYALRDMYGKYLGCMECTQDVEEHRHLEGERRLIDES
jgi:PAS domain S-box-containing protein